MVRAPLLLGVQDDTIVLLLEPLHGILLGEAVLEANSAGLALPVVHIVSCKRPKKRENK